MDFRCGNWEGEVTMHEEETAFVTYRIKQTEIDNTSKLKITLFYNERPYVFDGLLITEDAMFFMLDTGYSYKCRLDRDGDGNYGGGCDSQKTEEKRHISISMTLPEEGHELCTFDPDALEKD